MNTDHIDRNIKLVVLAAEIACKESYLDYMLGHTAIMSIILAASLLLSGWSTASVVLCTLAACAFYKCARVMYIVNFLRKEFTKQISRV
jgi:hypothetical protein